MTSTPEGSSATPPTDAAAHDGRFLNALSRGLLWPVALTVVGVITVSFVLSFQAQTELAILARIPAAAAWGLPVIVDGTILISTFAALILRPRGWTVAWWPWFVLSLFGAISIWSNGIHATNSKLTLTELFLVGAIPAVGLLVSTHMLVIMLGHGPRPSKTPAVIAPVELHVVPAAPVATTPPAAVKPLVRPLASVAAAKPPVATPATGKALTRQQVTERIAAANAAGETTTGEDVGTWMHVTAARGASTLNQIQATLNAGEQSA
jgi:hypothetical protein